MEKMKYIRRIDGSMIKKVTLENSLRQVELENLSSVNVTKIKDANRNGEKVLFEVKVDGLDIVEASDISICTLEVSDKTGAMTVMFSAKNDSDVKKLIDNIKVGNLYKMLGTLVLNDLYVGNKLLYVSTIDKVE